jgi:hypothetical protein
MWYAFLVFAMISSAFAEDNLTGFRGLKWGSTLPTDMIYLLTVDKFGGVQEYTRTSDKLTIGEAELEQIKYNYWHNRLWSVIVTASGYTNFTALKDALTAKYGKLVQDNEDIEYYNIALTSGLLILQYNETSESTTLLMMSVAIGAEMDAFDKERAQKGKDDF